MHITPSLIKNIALFLKRRHPKSFFTLRKRVNTTRRRLAIHRTERSARKASKKFLANAHPRPYGKDAKISCPVCSHETGVTLEFEWNDDLIQKNRCSKCYHLFVYRPGISLETVADEFTYSENDIIASKLGVEARALGLAIEIMGSFKGERTSKRHLCFGIGPNMQLVRSMNQLSPSDTLEVYGCDIDRRQAEGFFTTYHSSELLGTFDSISSHAVIEHLENTVEAWNYMNRLLKPVSESDSIMVHAFPSIIFQDPGDWSIHIRSHTCLFSRRSLKTLCRKTGFAWIESLESSGHHPFFVFLKTKDI